MDLRAEDATEASDDESELSETSWPDSLYDFEPIGEASSKSYPNVPIDTTKEIRILGLLPGHLDDEIRCELARTRLVDREANPMCCPYEALSYVWGTKDNLNTIRLFGCSEPFSVTQNLWSALRRLRQQEKTRWLWIDQLCINQELLVERNHQVQLMGKVYRYASSVVIWLGEPTSSHNVKQTCLDAELSEDAGLSEDTLKVLEDTLKDVIESSNVHWWERVWVVQEVANARLDPSLAFGPFEVSWRIKSSERYAPTVLALQRCVSQFRVLAAPGNHLAGIADIIVRTQSTVPHDKVYALLDLIDPGQKAMIQPDYSIDLSDLYTQATKASILYPRSLQILSYIDLRPRLLQSLPSWVWDFGYTGQQESPLVFVSMRAIPWTFRGDGNRHVRFDNNDTRMRMEGLRLDSILAKICEDSHECSIHFDFPSIPRDQDSFFDALVDASLAAISAGVDKYTTLEDQEDLLYTNLSHVIAGQEVPPPTVLSVYDIGHRQKWCDMDGMAPYLFTVWPLLLDELDRNRGHVYGLLKSSLRFMVESSLFSKMQRERRTTDATKSWELYLKLVSERSRTLVTRAGFLVLAAWDSRAGDVIVLPHGCSVPMLLRDAGDGTWTFQGFVYVYGIMNGELREKYPDLELPEEEFILS